MHDFYYLKISLLSCKNSIISPFLLKSKPIKSPEKLSPNNLDLLKIIFYLCTNKKNNKDNGQK